MRISYVIVKASNETTKGDTMNSNYATILIDDTTIGNCGPAVTIPSLKLDMNEVKQVQAELAETRATLFISLPMPTFKLADKYQWWTR